MNSESAREMVLQESIGFLNSPKVDEVYYALPVYVRTGRGDDSERIDSMVRGVKNANMYLELAVDKEDRGKIRDGYHSFDELYDHRIRLYIELCKRMGCHGDIHNQSHKTWISRAHSDGSVWDGWFILGINEKPGEQITYHLPEKYWEECVTFVDDIFEKCPDWDGHTSADVLERLAKL